MLDCIISVSKNENKSFYFGNVFNSFSKCLQAKTVFVQE